MKYLGIELPWNLTQKLNRFSKRGIGKLYVLLEPLHKNDDAFTRIDKLFNDPTTLAELVKEFGEQAKLKTVLDTLYNGKRRLATPKEEKEYAELLERRNKYVAEVKERKDRQKRNAEAMALKKARALIARHEKKAENAVKS
jgi:hypothetical protein